MSCGDFVHPILLQLAVQRRLADAEQPGGHQLVSFQLANGSEDGLPLNLRDRQDAVFKDVVGRHSMRCAAPGFGVALCDEVLDGCWEVADMDDGAGAVGAGTGNAGARPRRGDAAAEF